MKWEFEDYIVPNRNTKIITKHSVVGPFRRIWDTENPEEFLRQYYTGKGVQVTAGYVTAQDGGVTLKAYVIQQIVMETYGGFRGLCCPAEQFATTRRFINEGLAASETQRRLGIEKQIKVPIKPILEASTSDVQVKPRDEDVQKELLEKAREMTKQVLS